MALPTQAKNGHYFASADISTATTTNLVADADVPATGRIIVTHMAASAAAAQTLEVEGTGGASESGVIDLGANQSISEHDPGGVLHIPAGEGLQVVSTAAVQTSVRVTFLIE